MVLTAERIESVKKELKLGDDRLPFMFNALSDMGRFKIFKMLLTQKDLCVTDVAKVLGVSVPAASQQLRIMEMAGLLRKEREGQRICFLVKSEDPLVKSIIKLIK